MSEPRWIADIDEEYNGYLYEAVKPKKGGA